MKNNSFLNWLKSYRKWIILIIVILLAISGFGLLFVNWTGLKIIYSAGSSAVSPLLDQLNYVYRQETNKNIDINVLPTGSGNGIESIVSSQKDLGNISRSPLSEETGLPQKGSSQQVKGTYSNEWDQKSLKTVTWGWDTISIIYKPTNPDFNLDINDNNIINLYKCISGNQIFSLNDFKASNSPNDSTQIIPFARTGGAIKSGTTEAFIKSSHFSNASWDKIKADNFIKILETGEYPNNVITTKESNIESWNTISIDGKPGSMTYLSGGFVLSNLNEILKAGFKVATYNSEPLQKDKITKGYNWFRPLNSIISIKKAPDYVKEWVYWIMNSEMIKNDKVLSAFNNINIINLDTNQINSMCLNNKFNWSNFWVSDYDLYLKDKPLPFGANE